jgi:cytochrome c oxidase accessory protein FixG
MTTIAAPSLSEEHDSFRNALASVARDGRRRWIYARQPSGRYYRARTILSWFLLAFLLLAPFVEVGGQPLMLLNVLERRFVILGVLFRPQDFYFVVLLALTTLVTIVLATVVVGRVWCGWLCPQTVFMEMLFRKLEYLIEGSAEQQVRRERAPWTWDKAVRRTVKHGVFFGLSFVIANVFLAWIIGAGQLKIIVTDPPSQHLAGLSAIVVFSFVFYMVFVRFREQACILACPYGRMLSALTDARTVMVTYDWRRGEPRGRLLRTRTDAAGRTSGDCIDCHQCVTVCPTGIDIRDGIQLECVNCTACMDACDGVMTKVGRPRGLIRYTSEDALRHGAPRWISARSAAYGAVWLVLLGIVAVVQAGRRDVDVLILRQPGTIYNTVAGGDVANFYNVQVLNRTGKGRQVRIDVAAPAGGTVTPLGELDHVGPYGLLEGRVMVRLPPQALAGASTPLRFEVRTDEGVAQVIESAFLGPAR